MKVVRRAGLQSDNGNDAGQKWHSNVVLDTHSEHAPVMALQAAVISRER